MWWHTVTHGRGKWRGKWRMEWVASTLQTTSEHGVSSITTADAHTSAASSRLNCRPRRFKWASPFRRKTKSGFCACVITFQLACTFRGGLRRRGCIVPLIYNFGAGQWCMISVRSRSLYSHFEREAGWIPQSVRTASLCWAEYHNVSVVQLLA